MDQNELDDWDSKSSYTPKIWIRALPNKVRCKNKCLKYKVKFGYKNNEDVFCKACNVFIRKEGTYIKAGMRCLCCGQRVRTRAKRVRGALR